LGRRGRWGRRLCTTATKGEEGTGKKDAHRSLDNSIVRGFRCLP
jgi:hypothetical protein